MDTAAMITALWPLSRSFEWAAELGGRLASLRPQWQMLAPAALRQLRLEQARGFAFLVWLEQNIARDELAAAVLAALEAGPHHEQLDLAASCKQLQQRSASATASMGQRHFSEPPGLAGEAVVLYVDPLCAAYPGYGDLEAWTAEALRGARVDQRLPAPAGNRALARVHDERYLRELFAWGRQGGGRLTPETVLRPDSERALRASAGATTAALAAAIAGEQRTLLSFARPGSHHAGRSRAGGTCFVNHLAVAAASLGDGARVAILDIDAHHGNGSEQIFADCERILTISIHQAQPFFPGTGDAQDLAANLNLPVEPGARWREAAERALARVAEHRPDAVLVELSTDAHAADPVSALEATDDDFAFVAASLRELGVPVVYELGASMSERAWVGGLRSVVKAR